MLELDSFVLFVNGATLRVSFFLFCFFSFSAFLATTKAVFLTVLQRQGFALLIRIFAMYHYVQCQI